MVRPPPLPDWYEEDVVCVALIPAGQKVDWSPGSYEPEESAWPPEGTFLRFQALARALAIPILGEINLYVPVRLEPAECRLLLSHWRRLEEEVEGTPGAGWAAAIRLILLRGAGTPGMEVLIDGP